MNADPDPTNWDEFFEQSPYGVLVLKGDQIVHAVGYPRPATQQDANDLARELKSDADLGLQELEDYHISPVSGDDWRKYVQIFVGDE